MILRVKAGRYMADLHIETEGDRWVLKFGYSKPLIDEIKAMEGARWDPERRCWTVPQSQRNQYALDYLACKEPFKHYKTPLEGTPRRALREHQVEMFKHVITRRHSILACDMGTGKTLVAIEAMEWAKEKWNIPDHLFWYVGPVSGVVAVGRELIKWNCTIKPMMFTYDGLVSECKTYSGAAPRMIILDESSKLKTPTSQRSQVAKHIAEAIRSESGFESIVVEMTGTPAPKSPADWWHQAEVACPGFLREGTLEKFKRRLCVIENRESMAGGSYPHLVGWKDDPRKCDKCGMTVADERHWSSTIPGPQNHTFVPSVDEVSLLYSRLKGLVLIKFKKDCMELPAKTYEIIKVKPTVETLRVAKHIVDTNGKAVTALGRLRELSDGFQYEDVKVDLECCPACKGEKVTLNRVRDESIIETPNNYAELYKEEMGPCHFCAGTGEVDKMERQTKIVGSPKDAVFKELLDAYEENGRFIVWGGFTGTIDRLTDMAQKEGWCVLRIDGRGYHGFDPLGDPIEPTELLDAMDASNPRRAELLEKHEKVCVVAHPLAGGMGLTFTMSAIALYYSNDFSGEARIQSEDRAYRLGMDNRGYRIVDLIHLKSDQVVLDNLQKKRKLQDLTMGELNDALTGII